MLLPLRPRRRRRRTTPCPAPSGGCSRWTGCGRAPRPTSSLAPSDWTAPWTPPRAALWQEIAIALQARDARGDIARASALAQRDEEALLRQLGVLPALDDAGEDEDEAAE